MSCEGGNFMEKYIDLLYDLALKSLKNGDIPVGCIVVKNDKIIGQGYNNRHFNKQVIGHAEINAINEACKNVNDWRLNDCILYTTLKPCKMCFEVIEASRISKIYYLLDQDTGITYSNNKYIQEYFPGNNKVQLYQQLFLNFFQNIR